MNTIPPTETNFHDNTEDTTDTIYDNYSVNYGVDNSFLNYDSFEFTGFYEGILVRRPIRFYVYVTLVIMTVLFNILIKWVLLQKKMRGLTNILFVAIAISDSMTGLVTLPTYIMVFNAEPSSVVFPSYIYEDGNGTCNMTEPASDTDVFACYEDGNGYMTMSFESPGFNKVSKLLCDAFMISKYFFSQTFHTISIWLTLFLGIQRYISVAYPFKMRIWYTTKNTAIAVVLISAFAALLHVYHLIRVNNSEEICIWELDGGSNVQIWITLFLRHLIPSFVLTITTVLFIRKLNNNSFHTSNLRRSTSVNEGRSAENRRVSIIVVAIMILFLISEVPYGLFLLYLSINGRPGNSERNEAIYSSYEIIVVLSSHLHFYVYTFLNRTIRFHLLKTFSTFSSRLSKLCLSAREPSSSNNTHIENDTERKSKWTPRQKRNGNEIIESVV